MADITMVHNPARGTVSRLLAWRRHGRVDPTVVECLQAQAAREPRFQRLAAMRRPVHDLLRRKGAPCDEPRPDDPTSTDESLLDVMVAHAIGAGGAVRASRRQHALQHGEVRRGIVMLRIGGNRGIAPALEARSA
jgi:arsenate reductase-like glutaredoxin family protein